MRQTISVLDIQDMMKTISFDEVPAGHPVGRFTSFWKHYRNAEGLFSRSSFNPMHLPTLIPWVAILDAPETPGQAFIFRLCGTGFTGLTGLELTGKHADAAIHPEAGRALNWMLNTCVATNEPQYSVTDIRGADIPDTNEEGLVRVVRGVFPISARGEKVDQVLLVISRQNHKIPDIH